MTKFAPRPNLVRNSNEILANFANLVRFAKRPLSLLSGVLVHPVVKNLVLFRTVQSSGDPVASCIPRPVYASVDNGEPLSDLIFVQSITRHCFNTTGVIPVPTNTIFDTPKLWSTVICTPYPHSCPRITQKEEETKRTSRQLVLT